MGPCASNPDHGPATHVLEVELDGAWEPVEYCGACHGQALYLSDQAGQRYGVIFAREVA